VDGGLDRLRTGLRGGGVRPTMRIGCLEAGSGHDGVAPTGVHARPVRFGYGGSRPGSCSGRRRWASADDRRRRRRHGDDDPARRQRDSQHMVSGLPVRAGAARYSDSRSIRIGDPVSQQGERVQRQRAGRLLQRHPGQPEWSQIPSLMQTIVSDIPDSGHQSASVRRPTAGRAAPSAP